MAQGDYLIQNQSFPSFRSDLNSTLEAINTSNSGTSRPSSAVAGTVWLDTTSATTPTLKFYDGADDISLAQLDYTANTVNWLDSSVVADLVNDTTPQLGGDLDVNGNSIVSVSNGNITFTPDGTGKVIIDGLSYPTSDGTTGQFLKTDGSGNLSFDDVVGGTNTPAFQVLGNVSQSIPNSTYTKVQLTTELIDTDSAFDNSTNYRFTVPSGEGGNYLFSYGIQFLAFNASRCISSIRKNGTEIHSAEIIDHTSSDNASVNASVMLPLVATDYIELFVFQNSGTSNSIRGSTTEAFTYLSGFKLI
jgi:hypothetical protein